MKYTHGTCKAACVIGQMQVLSGKLINFFNAAISENGHNSLTMLKNKTGWMSYCSYLFHSTVSLPPAFLIDMEYEFIQLLVPW